MSETQQNISEFIDSLKKFANAVPEIKQIILFGSFSRGDANGHSDIDLAFVLTDESVWSRIALDLRETARSLRRLDLVSLASVSPDFRAKILLEGKTIYERK